MTLTVSVVIAVVLLALYAGWTAGRLDRLHARVDAAWAALDAQLVRRAAAARALAGLLPEPDRATALAAAAQRALDPAAYQREAVENELSRALRVARPHLPDDPAMEELHAAAHRVALARSVHNNAVNDTRQIRHRRLPRLLRLAGHRDLPHYFEIDDTALSG
ncbi:MAG TPA: NUDIX hydrolase [Mycobacteriales bacterium]|nr:NUDIX hydrolase [Mycobacteriales bacterium]